MPRLLLTYDVHLPTRSSCCNAFNVAIIMSGFLVFNASRIGSISMGMVWNIWRVGCVVFECQSHSGPPPQETKDEKKIKTC